MRGRRDKTASSRWAQRCASNNTKQLRRACAGARRHGRRARGLVPTARRPAGLVPTASSHGGRAVRVFRASPASLRQTAGGFSWGAPSRGARPSHEAQPLLLGRSLAREIHRSRPTEEDRQGQRERWGRGRKRTARRITSTNCAPPASASHSSSRKTWEPFWPL